MSFRWLVWSLLSPSQLILGCIIVGTVLLVLHRTRAARVLLLVGGSGLILFGLLPTSIYLANILETRFPQPNLPPGHVDGIVLLAGAERPTSSQRYGEPQVGKNAGRYVTTLRLAQRNPEARIVFSGGPRREPGKGPLETQAAVAERILINSGIDPARLRFDERSRDTCASGGNARTMANPRPGENWVVVASAMDVPRVMACFRAAGWRDVIPQPANYRSMVGGWNTGSVQMASNLELLDDAAHEWIGLLYYRLAGRTTELFPPP